VRPESPDPLAPLAAELIPVVAQDRVTGEIRMLAYASAEAVRMTIETGKATFFSRSRGKLWTKGETSGNVLDVHAVLADCDADALIYLVTPHGPSCHTGAPTCFFRRLADDGSGKLVPSDEDVPAPTLLARLDAVLLARTGSTAEKSYTKSLYEAGAPRIGDKLREEADELARAVASESTERVVSEAADVVFHVMIALRSRGIGVEAVLRELEARTGVGGHEEKKQRKPKAVV
jgi:phosphoribosyl-ATP pyrophosphohydrolase/phosphoribosyl-AMP cyclohydrolase